MKRSIILCVLVLGLVELSVTRLMAQDPRLLAAATRNSGDTFPIGVRTPRGASVYAVTRPSAAELAAIDRGLTDLFAVARKNGYSKRLNYGDYSVFIATADRTQNSEGQYSPDVAIATGQYAGSVYDKGGYMYVAGLVLSLDPCAFLIAEHVKDLDRMANVVRYEGEHLVLYHNDRRRFEATKDHSKGGSHPILQ